VRSAPRVAREPVDVEALRAEGERLRVAAEAAAARSRLRRSAPASGGDRDDDALPDDTAPRPPAARAEAAAERARLVGSAVHRVLEHFDPGAETDLERLLDGALAGLAPLATSEDQQAARDSARDLLARFARGALGARFRALCDHVVARELPVLLPAGESEATGFVAGAIDLVYRDPASGELVVVDYKTDRLGTQELAPERLAAYARQGAAYQRALRDALALERAPRFELWLLDADRCQVVPQDARPSERAS